MKDMYSFHASKEDALNTYHQVQAAYKRIFDRMGVETIQVSADSGKIGGNYSHEFHVPTEIGEDVLVTCPCGKTACNLEKARGRPALESGCKRTVCADDLAPLLIDGSPEKTLLDGVLQNLAVLLQKHHLTMTSDLRILLVGYGGKADEQQKLALVLLRADQQINETALSAVLPDSEPIVLKVETAMPLLSKLGLNRILIDWSACSLASLSDERLRSPIQEATVTIDHFRSVNQGDICIESSCASSARQDRALSSRPGIEIGHVFYLGTRYSAPLKARFLNAESKAELLEMGCYGIGVSRIMAAAVERYHDANGIVWPRAIAPYRVVIVATPALQSTAAEVANQLLSLAPDLDGEIVVDDRNMSLGARLKDAELIGFPFICILGNSFQETGQIELVHRTKLGHKTNCSVGDLVQVLRQ